MTKDVRRRRTFCNAQVGDHVAQRQGSSPAEAAPRLTDCSEPSAQGSFIDDFEGVAAGTELHEVTLQVLASVLGALRTRELETDATLLEAWLDAAMPDWRERVLDEDPGRASAAAPDPYDVLGVGDDAPMEEITAAFRRDRSPSTEATSATPAEPGRAPRAHQRGCEPITSHRPPQPRHARVARSARTARTTPASRAGEQRAAMRAAYCPGRETEGVD